MICLTDGSRHGNLHFAAALPLDNWKADAALRIVPMPTLAACDAIAAASAGALSPRIKWVNDVYLGTGKAAGVLTRTAILEQRADVLIVGIGINLSSTAVS